MPPQFPLTTALAWAPSGFPSQRPKYPPPLAQAAPQNTPFPCLNLPPSP